MGKISITYCILFVFCCGLLQAQPFLFDNPSFEGIPGASLLPEGWNDCGQQGQTPPDTHPANAFSVVEKPYHGETFIGLVVRDNDTWESIGQKLPVPLKAGQCYKFNIHLARSEYYYSLSMVQQKNVQFTNPVVLRVWGGYNQCDRKNMLFETKVVKQTGWKEYEIRLKPTRDLRYITFEAFYKTPVLESYRGNLLIDNLSPIVSCNEEIPEVEPLAVATPPKPPTKPITRPKPTPPVAKKPEPKPKEPEILNLDTKEIKTGDIINVKDLFFRPDSIVPVATSYKVMDEIYRYLRNNKNITIEVRGHTNGLPPDDYCDKLSTKRAQSVADYLIGKGIRKERIIAKGYGKREPIATNDTKAGRMKNQRVEIKILSTRN